MIFLVSNYGVKTSFVASTIIYPIIIITHHGVEPSNDPMTKRYMVGFQYIKKDSLCNQLRGSSIPTILSLFLPYAAYYQMAKYIPSLIPLWMSLVGLAGVFSPTNTWRSVLQFYVFCCFMTMDARLVLQMPILYGPNTFRKK